MGTKDVGEFHLLIICTRVRSRGPEPSLMASRPHYSPAAADVQRGCCPVRDRQLPVVAPWSKYTTALQSEILVLRPGPRLGGTSDTAAG